MGLINKYWKEIVATISLVALYFTTRLILLGHFPIFTDEAIYVRWSQIASADSNWRFISLTDGKQPMFVWGAMILIKLVKDALVASRLVSVGAGFATLVGIWFLTLELFKDRRAAFLSSLLYIFYPFAIVYDRMALYDSMVTAFAVWAIYFSILLVRKIRLDIALILGFILGGGMLTKSSSAFSIYLLPFTLLLFDFKNKKWKEHLFKWIIFVGVAALMGEIFYNALRLSPFFHIIAEKNTTFVYPFSEWIKHPFTFFLGNLKGLSGWLFTYLTPFYLIPILIALVTIKKFPREKFLLVIYFLFPFLALALFGKVIFPRFIFFMSVYLLPLASVGLFELIDFANKYFERRKIKTGAIAGLIILFFLLYPAKVSLDFIFNPVGAAIADSDKDQYITDWPAGGGVAQSIEYFRKQASNGPIFIGTEGTFGLMPATLEIFLGKNPNVKTKGYWPIGEQMPEDLAQNALKEPTYFIFYQPCTSCAFAGDAPKTWPLTLMSRFKKSNDVYYSVYKVNR